MAHLINGNLRIRFIQDAVLLCTLDPVRGEPTAYGLDQDQHDVKSSRSKLLTRKFLDSFALVCCTEKNRNSVSAACMEEGRPEGTIIRIASNAGVSDRTLSQLRDIVRVLGKIASRTCEPTVGEQDILSRIVKLDINKIRRYLEGICNSPDAFQKSLSTIETTLMENSLQPSMTDVREFLDWVKFGLSIMDLRPGLGSEVVIGYVKWAQNAKSRYSEFLELAFTRNKEFLPRWVSMIFKLGRYGFAARALVKLAFEFPEKVDPMFVEPLSAPPITRFPQLDRDKALSCVLKRVVGNHKTEQVVAKLAQIWNNPDPETHFQRASSADLVAHAEMQLVNFYDHNPELIPQYQFIGVSKKSCYLCDLFIRKHPGSFFVSSCHQKLYSAWIPPPAAAPVYNQYKIIIGELIRVMESTAKSDLEFRLGITRRPIPADSTAGVSLSGLTDLVPRRPPVQTSTETYIYSQNNSVSEIEIDTRSVSSRMEQERFTPMDTDSAIGGDDISYSTNYLSKPDSGKPNSEIVFHIVRSNDSNRQDIIQLSDIFDSASNCASWTKLVRIMQVENRFRLAFKEDQDFLLVSDQIRVANERQLLACIKYLQNADTLNVKATVLSDEGGGSSSGSA